MMIFEWMILPNPGLVEMLKSIADLFCHIFSLWWVFEEVGLGVSAI